MASLLKRGKYYYYRFTKTINGSRKQKWVSSGMTEKTEAMRLLVFLEDEINKGAVNPFSELFDIDRIKNTGKTGADVTDFSDLAETFIAHKKPQLAASTIKSYRHVIRQFLQMQGNISLALIDADLLQNFLIRDDIKPVTMKKYKREMKAILNFALKHGYLDRNPISDVQLPKVKESTMQKMPTQQEIEAMIDTHQKIIREKSNDKYYRWYHCQSWFPLALKFVANTGMRRNEAITLQPSNIVNDGRAVRVERQKGIKQRYAVMPKWLAKKIAAYIDKHSLGMNDFVFCNLNTPYNHITGERFWEVFAQVRNKAPVRDTITIHGLRHFRATQLLSKGHDISTVAKLLGHSTVHVTYNYYAHLNAEQLISQVDSNGNRNESK